MAGDQQRALTGMQLVHIQVLGQVTATDYDHQIAVNDGGELRLSPVVSSPLPS